MRTQTQQERLEILKTVCYPPMWPPDCEPAVDASGEIACLENFRLLHESIAAIDELTLENAYRTIIRLRNKGNENGETLIRRTNTVIAQTEPADPMPYPNEPALRAVASLEIAKREDVVRKIMQIHDGGILLKKFNERLAWLERNTVRQNGTASKSEENAQPLMPLAPKVQKELDAGARQLVDDLAILEKYDISLKPSDFRNQHSGSGGTKQYRGAVQSLSAWIRRMEARNIDSLTIRKMVNGKIDELTSTSVR